MSANLSPVGNGQQFFTAQGAVLAGGKINTYLAGTTTRAPTFTDSTQATQNANPIILGSNGMAPNEIWLPAGSRYKYVITDANDNIIPGGTLDNLVGINDSSSAASEWVGSGVTPTYISAASFSVPGDKTGTFTTNRRIQATVSAGTVYGYVSSSSFGGGVTTVNVVMDSTALDNGISAVNVGLLNATNPSVPVSLMMTAINGHSPSGLQNRIINGNFAINQRGVSGTVTLAAGAYGHDRWKAGAGGCTYTFVQSGLDTTITITAGSLMQVIESINVEGGVYRLSHQGTAQARVAVNGAATSGAYAATPLVTASATGNLNITVEFTTGTVDRVQLEPGTIATSFERRPAAFELILCQRYYERLGGTATGDIYFQGYSTALNSLVYTLFYKQTKRVIPTINKVGSWITFNSGQPAINNVGQNSCSIGITLNVSDVGYFYTANTSNYLEVVAEL